MQYIIKRDGRKKKFDSGKIKSALLKAMVAARNNDPQDNELEATNLTQKIVSKCYDTYKDTNPTVEQIQDIVVSTLIESGIVDVSKAYILYREERSQHRDSQTALMKKIEDITFSDAKESNLKRDNANVDGNTAMGTMLQYGSTVSKQFATDRLLNPEFRNEFLKGNIYPHDLDFMPMGTETCLSGYTVITVKGADDSVRDIKIKELDHFFNGMGDKQEIAYMDNLFILGRRGWTKLVNVSRHKRTEKEKYYFIKTLNGIGLRATGEHRIPVIRNEEEALLSVKEIVVGDSVYLINKDLEVPEIHYLRDEITDIIEINDEGYVYDIETEEHWFIANGYLVHNCLQLPLDKLFKDGFNTGHGTLREPQSIASYASLTAIALQANQNDQHGGQSIPLLDFYLAPGVSKSYLKNIKNNLKIILGFMDDDKDIESVFKEINEKDPDLLKLKNKDKLIEKLSSYFNNEKMCRKAVEEAILQVDKQTYQAMEGLVHNLNTMHCLPYSEKIWVYDMCDQELLLMPIGELSDVFEENRYYAISLNKETFDTELKKITAIQKKDNHRRLITLITKAGQKITTTDNHEILSYDKEQENVIDMLPEDISYILSPRNFQYNKVKNYICVEDYAKVRTDSKYFESHVIITESLAELMGYYVADGSITGGCVLTLTTCDKIDVDYLINLTNETFGSHFSTNRISYGDNKHKEVRITIGTRLAKMFLDKCGSNSHQKKIPTEILFGSREVQIAFLNAYLKCDGRQGEKYAEAVCVSETLIAQIHFMCSNLGELTTVSYKSGTCPFNGKPYTLYGTVIGGKPCERIGIKLNEYPTIEYPKYDLSFIRDMSKSNKFNRRHSGNVLYCELDNSADIDQKYAKLFNIEVIEKLESNSGEEYVYDLSVEDNENFLTKDCIFVHNSRAGAQVPFSSINFGMDTSEEGRMVSKNLMLAQEAGLGNGETPIFPILIFQVKEGVNYNPEDPNYDLFKLSMRVSSKRLFPNFVFVDAPYNLQYYDPKDPETIISTMGCVDDTEVITYMYKGHVRVESFGRAWKRISKDNEVQTFGDSEYFDLNDVKIFDSLTNEFVDCYKMLRNKDAGNWYKITFANGRQLIATGDHPLPLVNKGRTYVKDLERGDSVYANYKQHSEEAYSMSKEDAYLLGAVLRNASYRKTIHIIVKQEREIEDILKDCLRKYTKDEIIINPVERENGELYYEISVNDPELSEEFCNVFEGVDKTERIIPNLLFEVENTIRTAFLAGVVDASGDIYDDGKVEFSGSNRELLLQLMLFIQSTGVPAKFREVRRTKNKKEFVVSFRMPKELCELEIGSPIRKRINGVEPAIPTTAVEITNIEYIGFRNRMSYDVETASDYFDVSGILSHNCRTRVIGNVNGKQSPVGRGNLSFTTINLPRLGIEYGVQYRQAGHAGYDREGFYKELDHMIDLAIDQLLDRLEIQKHKKVKNFPFLMGQGLWKGSEKLGANDEIGDILNEGTLSVGFIGLAECLEGLIQQHHGETNEAQELGLEIIGYMRKRMDDAIEKYHLNFSLLATPAEGLSGYFTRIDKKRYGVIEKITDRDYYTNSFHVPVYYPICAFDKIQKEAPYHALTNAGHISYIEMDGDPSNNLEAFEAVVRCMKESGIGYGSINHPVDRDPCCGYAGIIPGHVCPKCGRSDIEHRQVKDNIKRIKL